MAFCFIFKLKITLFYLLSFAFIRCTIPCLSLSLIAICCHSLSFIDTRCHTLLLVVPLVVIRCTSLCHSLSLVVSLVVIRCTTRLSFYKGSDFLVLLKSVCIFPQLLSRYYSQLLSLMRNRS